MLLRKSKKIDCIVYIFSLSYFIMLVFAFIFLSPEIVAIFSIAFSGNVSVK